MVNDERRQWYRIRNAAETADGSAEILIYDEIDSYWGVAAGDLVRDIAKIDSPNITVRINSPGGDVFDGIAILNALRGHDAKVTTVIDGLAASIASVIAMAGDEIVMNANSEMMLHNASSFCCGDSTDMQKTADMLAMQNKNIASVYASRAGGTVDDWLAVMAEETWLSADEAVECGLAHRVADSGDNSSGKPAFAGFTASFDRSKFRYAARESAPTPRIAALIKTPSPNEAQVPQQKEGTIVATLHESLAEKLGLAADADDAAILAAFEAATAPPAAPAADPAPAPAAPAPAPEPTAEDIRTVAAKFGLQVVDQAVHDRLVADARAGAEARAQQVREANERIITDALRSGKIAAASADKWRKSLSDNHDSTVELLATLPTNSIPTSELGHGIADESDPVNADLESTFNRVMASAGYPVIKKGAI